MFMMDFIKNTYMIACCCNSSLISQTMKVMVFDKTYFVGRRFSSPPGKATKNCYRRPIRTLQKKL